MVVRHLLDSLAVVALHIPGQPHSSMSAPAAGFPVCPWQSLYPDQGYGTCWTAMARRPASCLTPKTSLGLG